ncbi:NAD(P)/FAD-dependent oxidoreductase [Nitrincola sp. MINF-07-Sa-05]|uniref:NAD(P)/FAD-dependent oxidoreductase n=1 Tax=Nitrincola salilacus TaxID=3400273 RepID=UPI003917E6A0
MKVKAIRPLRIAVIGSGISGLSCAWLLNQQHQVTLFEKDDRLGGHSNTVDVDVDGKLIPVDTGFIVFNPVNYPNLVKFFEQLNVASSETEMSFAVSMEKGRLEYSGTNINGLFAQRSNLLKPRFWKMIADLLRFYRESSDMLNNEEFQTLTLRELLAQGGYGEAFVRDHLIPMGAAIWSTPADKMLDYPAQSFLRFCQNHGLVQLENRPQWRTVIGGSREYVTRIADALKGRIRLNSHIHRIHRLDGKVILEDLHGGRETFDHVVLACHADQSLEMLAQPDPLESDLLSKFPYQRNRAILHCDTALMPRRKSAWASWNYLSGGSDADKRDNENSKESDLSVTYWMNRLQPLSTSKPLLVTLNPVVEPEAGSIYRSFLYDHPVFTLESISAQKKLWALQGHRNTWFCGAYFGYGFHEDGLQAGLAVAEALGGIQRPWQVAEPNGRIHVHPPKRPSVPQAEEAVA